MHPATNTGALQVTSISMANVKRCFILSTAAHRPNWRVAYHSFTGWRWRCSMVDGVWLV